MSVNTQAAGGPPSPHNQALILAVTVAAFAAIVVLALTGHAVAAGGIGGVWFTTCGVLGYKKP